MMKNINTIILFILTITIGVISWWYLTKMNQVIQKFEDNIEKKENIVDSLNQRLYLVDSTYRKILDSLPIGPPLDTININNGYGVRRHPIHGGYHLHSGVDLLDSWHDTVYATGAGIVQIFRMEFWIWKMY